LGPALVAAAREAFIQGLQLTAAISAVGAIGLAIFVATLLRHVQPSSEPAREPARADAVPIMEPYPDEGS
ncbi:MAG: MFS transporter, partial [Armatimonadota bacterium]